MRSYRAGNTLSWKQPGEAPIPKVKHHSQFKDMRPLSLLFNLGKVTEKLIANKQLRAELPPMSNQHAYTPSLGTTDAYQSLE